MFLGKIKVFADLKHHLCIIILIAVLESAYSTHNIFLFNVYLFFKKIH